MVKPKGSKAVDAYTEADDVSGSKGEASESKNDDGSESKTTIRNLIELLKIIKAMWKMTVPSSW